ncbi:NAD(P)/FAD-dependent oxidoreductase [Gordonia phthalatica]|uniref:Thioredoxin reductase n=1 Tax=Gordonia phthalatica TaxID=1136941 RepID=A0A0N9N2D4_9ACTN|nr:NAD(P)/FAD-dependent oxidoreductase [Gordonia phthalatica]ALG84801.1 thioredoxin reductase [Gordonia phthalatica]
MSGNQTSPINDIDVAVVGGGAAGLSAAVALGRSLRSVVVIDAGEQRNLPASTAHNVLGREGVAPRDLIAAGREEAERYAAEIVADTVVEARRDDEGFALVLASGRMIRARRILLTTGLVDHLPDIPGLADAWGATVLHCPYCHGWEVRGQRIGVLATGPMAEHQALLFHRLSDRVTVFDHAAVLDGAARRRLAAMDVSVVDGAVGEVRVDGTRVRAVLVGPTAYEVDAVVVGSRMHARAEVFTMLGGTVSEHPLGSVVEVDPMGRTSVDGVWAAGNVCDLSAMVGTAAGAGVKVGVALNADLIADEVRALISEV